MSGFTHEPAGGGSFEWYTPPELFSAIGLEFDLDPCAPPLPKAAWLPHNRISLPADGLQTPWSGRVWLNPPYARESGRWVAKLAEHGDGVALVFARTDTVWWQSAIAHAAAVCFIAGRVNFVPSDPAFRSANGARHGSSNAGAPSCLLAYGEECAAAVRRCGLGICLLHDPATDRLSLFA